MAGRIKRYFITGLLVVLPIWATIALVHALLRLMDEVLDVLPIQYQPETLLGITIPGVGLVIIFLLILIIGFIASNMFGRAILRATEWVLQHIPLVRSIYTGIKQATDVFFSDKGTSFRQVVQIEYPRKGMYSVAFVTNDDVSKNMNQFPDESMMVFVPTTPNPTSGFLLIVKKKEAKVLDIGVEEALKLVISLGTVSPTRTTKKQIK